MISQDGEGRRRRWVFKRESNVTTSPPFLQTSVRGNKRGSETENVQKQS
jgi:hypothetical protein